MINVPVVVVAIVAAVRFTPETLVDTSKPWDLISSVYSLVTLSALVIAIKESAHSVQNWELPAISLITALTFGILFTRRQNSIEFPLLDFSIFKNNAFAAGTLAAAFALFAIAGIQLVTTQRFQLVALFTPLEAGLLVSAVAIGALPTALVGGAFLHRVGLCILIAGGLAVSSAAVLFTSYGISHCLVWVVLGQLLTGAGLGATMSVASTAIVGNVPAHRAGMAASVEEVSYEFGSLFAVTILGSLSALIYTLNFVLPDGVPESARDSIGAALALADQADGGKDEIRNAAAAAFDTAFSIVMYVISVSLALGALVTSWLLRKYGPGSESSSYPTHH